MTIERTDIGWVAVCDKCGAEFIPDFPYPHQAVFNNVVSEILNAGWEHSSPNRHKFKDFNGSYTETYQYDECDVCSDPAPAPKPVTRATPITARPSVGITNDPCDEWPKHAIYELAGLMSCGHVWTQFLPCPMCQYEADTGRYYRSTL